MKFELPPLPYPHDALEPHLDTATMHVHHDKHHQAYVDRTNSIVSELPALKETGLGEILTNINSLPIDDRAKIMLRNHGGGHANHSFFWQVMGPTKNVDQELVNEITTQWGSLEKFKEDFSTQSLGHFGSGWTWLVRDQQQALKIYTLPNQDSPLTLGHEPVLCLDLWEHAYYLKYKNVRTDYIGAWWNVVKFLP